MVAAVELHIDQIQLAEAQTRSGTHFGSPFVEAGFDNQCIRYSCNQLVVDAACSDQLGFQTNPQLTVVGSLD